MGASAVDQFPLALPFGNLACENCRYGLSGRCEGAINATVESYLMQDESVIGCVDGARQKEFCVDLYGLWEPREQKAKQGELLLPRFIPVVKRGLKQVPRVKTSTLFGVSLSTLLQAGGTLRYRSPQELRSSLMLPLNARVALIGTALDHTIERFWQKSELQDAWDRIAALEFEFATSLTFSVWDKHPRFDQIFNQDRNLATHDFLLGTGVTSIPFLFFYNARDYSEMISWLKDRTDIRKVAIEAQFFENTSRLALLIDNMRRLRDDAARSLEYLVVGPSVPDRISMILNEFPNATIVTDQPIFKAIMGYQTLADLRHVQANKRAGHGRLAANNVEAFTNYCDQPRLWDRAA
jgi:hypothetical protein